MILGIEIGGTKLQLGVSDGKGTGLSELQRFEVCREDGAAGILRQIQRAAPVLISNHGVRSVGIGFGGPVDPVRHCLIKSHHVQGWDEFPMRDWCQQHLGCGAVLGNDCNVAALAEARLGAGVGAERVFYVTIGTGIGGGFVVEGRIDGQDRPAIAEIGHLRPGVDARGRHQTVESLASGLGIESQARRRLEADRGTDALSLSHLWQVFHHDPTQLTAKRIASAALDSDPLALEVMTQATDVLGWAIAQMVTLIAPQRVVVGGGVSLTGDWLFRELRKKTAVYSFAPLAGSFEIVPAALGELSVVHGAILLAADG